ncbi:hypothetical protein DdX_18101 [Ditylenchus destructor]|uniref:Uncharacterized protein n=1 Tax=Ditylenchus destructor TaxID=166010 RepID=A0AAD4MLC6_9BILA|nr:hypothetical protein DdX_18101 [Ditylenchus destructor]
MTRNSNELPSSNQENITPVDNNMPQSPPPTPSPGTSGRTPPPGPTPTQPNYASLAPMAFPNPPPPPANGQPGNPRVILGSIQNRPFSGVNVPTLTENQPLHSRLVQ